MLVSSPALRRALRQVLSGRISATVLVAAASAVSEGATVAGLPPPLFDKLAVRPRREQSAYLRVPPPICTIFRTYFQ